MDRHLQVDSIRDIIERIGYDGVTHRVSIRFQTAAITAAEKVGA
jgi:hypothetical protein